MSLPHCSGQSWGRACSFSGKWEYKRRYYCELHRPDRVEHYRHARAIRAIRDKIGKEIADAVMASDDAALVALARRYRELHARCVELWAEGRRLYCKRHAPTPMPMKAIRSPLLKVRP